jgi:hypothetical protein
MKTDELGERAKFEACAKIVQQRAQFSSQFSSTCTELAVLEFEDVKSFSTLCMKSLKSEQIETLLVPLLNTPWNESQDQTKVLPAIVEVMEALCSDRIPILSARKRLISSCVSKLQMMVSNSAEITVNLVQVLVRSLKWMADNDQPVKDMTHMADMIWEIIQRIGCDDASVYDVLIGIGKSWCCSSESEVAFAKALLRTISSATRACAHDISRMVCADILSVAGSLFEQERGSSGTKNMPILKLVTPRSLEGILDVPLSFIKNRLEDCAWLLEVVTLICKSSITTGTASLTLICNELFCVGEACVILVQANFSGSNHSKFMESLQLLFKTSTLVAKLVTLSMILYILDAIFKVVSFREIHSVGRAPS